MPIALSVTTDLIFSSRISAAAAACGVDCRAASSPDAVATTLDDLAVGLVLVDMTINRQVAAEAVRRAAAHPSTPTVIAYYPHVQADLRDAAVRAGADQVLPRSRFVEQLPGLLAALSGPTRQAPTGREATDT